MSTPSGTATVRSAEGLNLVRVTNGRKLGINRLQLIKAPRSLSSTLLADGVFLLLSGRKESVSFDLFRLHLLRKSSIINDV